MAKPKKQTVAARKALAQYARPALQAKLREAASLKLTEGSEEDTPSSSMGRKLRSGRLSGGETTLDSPTTPFTSSQPRPRPIPRPCPVQLPPEDPQTGTSISHQDKSPITDSLTLEHPGNHSQLGESGGPVCSGSVEAKEDHEDKVNTRSPAPPLDNQEIVEPYDSDIMIIDEPDGHSDEFWDSNAEDATRIVTYQAPASVIHRGRAAWSGNEYNGGGRRSESAERLKELSVKSEPTSKPVMESKPTSMVKIEPKVETKIGSSTRATQSKKKQPLKHKWDELDSDSEGESPARKKKLTAKKLIMEEEDEVESEDMESDDSEEEKKINPQELYFEVPARGIGVRVVKLDRFTSYRTFCRKVAEILGCSVKDLSIGYTAGKAKELKGNPAPRVLEEEEDYDEMVRDAVKAMEGEVTRYQKEKAKLAAAAKKAKGKAGAPSKKKPVEMQQYVIRLKVLESEKANKKGSKGKSTKKTSKRARQASVDSDSDAASTGSVDPKEQLSWHKQLLAKYNCNTHNQLCYPLLPASNNEPGYHVPFERGDLLLWAKHMAKETDGVDMHHPPSVLNIYDPSRKRIKMREAIKHSIPVTPSDNHEGNTAGVGNGNAPNHHASGWMSNPMFFPPWFFPPYTPGSPAPAAPATPAATVPIAQNVAPNDPLLSEWLPKCDEGQRGADGHLFSQYLPSFQANLMVRLSDIALLNSARELMECIADHPPKMPFGTASRLLHHAKTDYKAPA